MHQLSKKRCADVGYFLRICTCNVMAFQQNKTNNHCLLTELVIKQKRYRIIPAFPGKLGDLYC